MRKITSQDLRDIKILKHYRIIRKWACKTCNLNDADLELLLYLEAVDLFTKDDFKKGTYSYSWDNRRWNRLLKQGWITVWRERNRTTQKYHIYKVSTKDKLKKVNKYSYKVITTSIENVNKDKRIC